jgi:hypothetical protein
MLHTEVDNYARMGRVRIEGDLCGTYMVLTQVGNVDIIHACQNRITVLHFPLVVH